MPHHQTARVSPGDKLVVAPGIDLHLILVEAVPQVARDHAVWQRLALRIGDPERLVVQTDNIVLANHVTLAVHFLSLRHEATPDLRQLRQWRLAVAVELHVALGRHSIERMLHAREVAI